MKESDIEKDRKQKKDENEKQKQNQQQRLDPRPKEPKRPPSAYFMFASDHANLGTSVVHTWKNASSDIKKLYEDKAEIAKADYNRKLAEYQKYR